MDRPSPEIVDCPACGARNFAIDDACARCGATLCVYIGPPPKIRHVSLGSVMIVVGVVAICLAPVRVAPGISLILALILVPGVTRAILHIEGRKVEGRPMDGDEKFTTYLASVSIAVVLLVASSAAFFATCVPVGFVVFATSNGRAETPGFLVAFAVGFVVAGFVLYRLGRTLWPRKD